MRFQIIFLVLIYIGLPLSAQIEFFKAPKPMQLFARNASNYGEFQLQGKSNSSGTLTSVVTEMLSHDTVELFITKIESAKSFTVHHTIQACLKEYQLDVFFSDAVVTKKRVLSCANLLAGDFYIAGGQSNASCPQTEGWQTHDSIYNSPFIRAIGGDFSWANTLTKDSTLIISPETDFTFGRASSQHPFEFGHGFSGIWPLKVQCLLANETGIPNCLVNGSQGGVGIIHHFASHTPSHPDSLKFEAGKNKPAPMIYDRVYKKLYMNDALAGVKGVLWYQGETDGTYPRDSSYNYIKRFRRLYNSWKADYPSLEKVFVFQLNLGCSGEYHSMIRDIQRRFPEEYKDVVVMSTVGSPLSDRLEDICHYTVPGYARIADKLLPLVKKHIYNFPLDDELILPANIQKAYYTKNDQICLEFNKNISIEDSCIYTKPIPGVIHLKDYFYDEMNVQINLSSLSVEKNKLFLNLKANLKPVKKITYLPQMFTKIPSLYSGPWILTENNKELGAYTFYEFPVKQIEKEREFNIYPNPANKSLHIELKKYSEASILLFDLYGKKVFSSEILASDIDIDLSDFASGIYILQINNSERSIRTKIVKE